MCSPHTANPRHAPSVARSSGSPTKPIQQPPTKKEPMASPFCAAAAACRLAVSAPSPPAAQAPRPRRGLVAVRAEAAGGGINPAIRKEEDKVVDTVLTGELAKPLTAYCRCWRSGTFPLCDGAHVKHNKATGDNVGPLLVKK
ncbi:hypothetical protein BDA96_02G313700 [Sorghum bicolor]|uniref:Iron-binding zinc finger CDGSH type domain-containing protein n=2 Tax=Sorghum bicolor TaxID=4558 RepID=A0A921UUC2_SORBI|nr:CDGSH iron-sulfur domain-containing protein NEET [Sorghum bicolor]EER97189.1 hypothetical protein SORBI_3002G297900 [Sorghum bicolor]KAG0544869.1 hypothetical protein BDA96_02G313700 [Sorghum bicolor]|eukprot:XP_002460668.1 CDGSH iron-sulfur domain-containing protein NEET [Sorghum bicolor]